jgi:flagellar biosynthesis/type III secretory pathway M-ring protein FliF/YscJ
MTTLLFVLLGINLTALVVVWILYRKARKAQKKRRVEAPNSEYKSRYVLDLESRDRWERLDLSRLHEVNREEVEKVLAKLKATSARALTNQERAFLDNMVEAERRARRTEHRTSLAGRHGTPSSPTPQPGAG